MIIDQNIAVARTLARSRITQQAKRMYNVIFRLDEDAAMHPGKSIEIEISIQHIDREAEFDFGQFKKLIVENFLDNYHTVDYTSYIVISDQLYEIIASHYPARDIQIIIRNNENDGVTTQYNTTKPYQSLAI